MTAEQANRARQRNVRKAAKSRRESSDFTARSREVGNSDDWAVNDRNSSGRPSGGDALSMAMGVFSVGLGVAQLLAPNMVSRFIGVRPTARSSVTMRLFGIREIASGIGMLTQPKRSGWAWSRVVGDALDIATLRGLSTSRGNNRTRLAVVTAATVGVAAVDLLRARQLRSREQPRIGRRSGIQVRRSVTINRPINEVYEFWRNFENLPQFMQHLEAVHVTSQGFSHWKAKGPAGTHIEWDAELIEDQPNERIAWRSVANADVENSGCVSFLPAPGNRGTEVHVSLQYHPPAGKLGALVARLFGEEPDLQVSDDLRRFKQLLETGEILHSDASLHEGMHPAQPSARDDNSSPLEVERKLAVARVADATDRSSNVERDDTHERDRKEVMREADNADNRSAV